MSWIPMAIAAGASLFGGKGSKGKYKQLPRYTPEQMSYMNRMRNLSQPGIESGMGYLSQLLSDDPNAMQAFEAPYMRQFEEQTVPQLAERFAGMDAQSSSAFGQSLSQAGAGLSENLAMLRASLKAQALAQLQGIGAEGLQQMYDNTYQQGQPSAMSGMMGGIGQGMGMMMPQMFQDMNNPFSSLFNRTTGGGPQGPMSQGAKNWFGGLPQRRI